MTEENACYLLEQEEKFVEIMQLYFDKIDKKMLDLKEKVDGISKQIFGLAPLLLEEGEKLLERELLDGHISMFHKALEAKPLAELEYQAVLIKEIFNKKLDAIKNNFVRDSKRRFERINEQVCPYSEIESAKRILQEVASLQTIFADFSQNDADQLALLLERVTKCVEEADSFHCIIVKQEGDKKTDLRPAIYSITKFFDEEKPVLDQIKEHGEKIRHGYWDADEKSGKLQEISDRANAIKAKNEELFQNTEVDKAKVGEIRDELQGLYSFISSNEETLSRYRGISVLRPLAKLWGGGKVTSMQYANEIKEELAKLNEIVAHI
ncbi:hypothetical protein [Rickettsiella endosymbiont of Dermanyssus gallinae]|uniref:hypothetical protein n=1 Tax=Rickettsiella endosymbiont of Dermanyssus gallinae TaxID=2856608 RepID=UPI001C52C7BA|nr:hypothetical protein [Rickettsiella endosymbiont of Dermanyssus gallinae]